MELKSRLLKCSNLLPVAVINTKTAEKVGLHPHDRITIKKISGKNKESSAIVDISNKIVKENYIALSKNIKEFLELEKNEKVEINISMPSDSISFIKKKMNGKPFSKKEIETIIKEIVTDFLSDVEIALFISVVYKHGLNNEETINLIEAFRKTGDTFKFKNKFVVDKHCIGGVPGNRTTPIVVSICAAAGLLFPKNSSRAITSAAGTSDVIETIARVEFSDKEVKKILSKTNACLIWGGSTSMVPADSKIIRIEKALKIDPESILIASILSKKIAAGSNCIIIDIPYGEGAKFDKRRANNLKKKFEFFGKYFKKNIKCILTDGSNPIGNGIGPSLELIDIINILDPEKKGPEDLQEKSLLLSGLLFEMTGKSKKGNGIKLARQILNSGKAFEKFKEIINAQEGNLNKLEELKFKKDILSKKSGKISLIENKKINSLARVAGCPIDKYSGVYLYVKKGDVIKKGQKIMTIYAESIPRLNTAKKYYEKTKPFKIEKQKIKKRKIKK